MKVKCDRCEDEFESSESLEGQVECICKECVEEMHNMESLREEEWQNEMNELYTYDEDGFCDGFTKY